MEFFRAYKANLTTPTYFIESTAPDNVDDTGPLPDLPPEYRKYLTEIHAEQAVQEIAETLVAGPDSNLVVMVHGFNNPEPAVLNMYTGAAMAIERDGAINGRKGLVCIGYRWPSESMGEPWHGTWDALPTFPTWLLNLGVIIAVVPFLLFYLASWAPGLLGWLRHPIGDHLVTILGLTLLGLVLTAALLRAIVYFRDTYRATNFGVPDLVHIIRVIDGKVGEIRQSKEASNDIQLSFIGHSMGGFVVTNTIRVLSDVFEGGRSRIEAYGAAADPSLASSNIGHVFQLKRFVLASPDIPAETLLTSRSNFLASALVRFDEAYLFSNEGDEVLRQISTLANYFVFPTRSRNHGFRLGNVEILSRDFGLTSVARADILKRLRIGHLTLQELYDGLLRAAEQRQRAIGSPTVPKPPVLLPERFTYFDCTDYTDDWTDWSDPDKPIKPARPLLSFANWYKRNDEHARLPWHAHLRLLFVYLFTQRPNVHAGYFQGLLSQQLIYRLACLGYNGTIMAYGSEQELGKQCKDKKIRLLVSPELPGRPAAVASSPTTPSG
ncbi:hypothetical protein [Bradyrhizobium sp.]|uniref:hypothetical protein n=1 Tax=Bradyrhizobium sp. TaxID=376 RepID=UPI001EBC9A3D|nr:hypothetical protein [Bradyrhizobium sp.]MBV9978731.1 alpha/beta hydrolase [Bradyrhizobium sp.]